MTPEQWFESYLRFLDEQDHSKAPRLGEFYLCPCCRFPTLEERGGYDICSICWWEDDGQNDDTANLVTGGPNKGYSLTAARRNFLDHRHMYDLGKGNSAVEYPSPARHALLLYVEQVISGTIQLDTPRLVALIEQGHEE